MTDVCCGCRDQSRGVEEWAGFEVAKAAHMCSAVLGPSINQSLRKVKNTCSYTQWMNNDILTKEMVAWGMGIDIN